MDPTAEHHSSSSRISSGPWLNQGMSLQTSSNMGVGHPLESSFPLLAANSFEGQWNYMEETSQNPNIPTAISQDARNKHNDKNSRNLQGGTKDGSSEHHCTVSAQMPDGKTFNIPHRVKDEFFDAELENQVILNDNKRVKTLNTIDSSLNGMISAQVHSPHWLTEQYTSPSFGSRVDNVNSGCESSISSEQTDMKFNYRPIKGRYSCMAGDVPSQGPVKTIEDLPISKGVTNGQGRSYMVEKAASSFPYYYSHQRTPSRNMPSYRQDVYEGFTIANTNDTETESLNSGCNKDSRDKVRAVEDSSFVDQSLYTTWSFPPPPSPPPPPFPYKAALSVRRLPLSNPGYCYQQRTSSSMNGQEMRLSSVTPSNLPGLYPSDVQGSKPKSSLALSGTSNFGDGTILSHSNEPNAKSTGYLQTDSRSVSVSERKVTSVPALEKHCYQSVWDYSTVSQDNYQPVEHATIKLKSSHSTVLQPNSKVRDFEKEEAETTSKTGEMHVPSYIPAHKRRYSLPSSSNDSSPVSTAGKSRRLSQYRKPSHSLIARKTGCSLAESSSISSRGDTDSDDGSEEDVSVASQESLTMPYYDPTRPPPVLPPFPASPFWSTYTSSESSVLLGHDQMKSFSSRPKPGKTNSSDLELVDGSHGGTVRKERLSNSRLKPRSLMTTETDGDSPRIQTDWKTHYKTRVEGYGQTYIDSHSPSIQTDWKTHYKTRVEGYGQTYIDSHCHLDFLFNRSGFKGTLTKFKELNQYAFPKTYEGCVAVFCNPASFNPTGGFWMDVAAEKDVWLAFGCHPKMAIDFSPWAEQQLQECMQHPKAVALGEIGLDYSGKFRQHEAVQKDVFCRQLKIALEMSKPLVIHCRDAEEDCLRILKQMVPSDYKIHCHCFTGYIDNAKLWMEAFPNLYIGLTPLVTYRNAVPSHNLARFLPLSKLLLETDAPYFIPRQVPKNEVAFSHPGFAVTVAEEVARIKEIPVDIVLNAARKNTRDMYGI